jgi:hypothetical protein
MFLTCMILTEPQAVTRANAAAQDKVLAKSGDQPRTAFRRGFDCE